MTSYSKDPRYIIAKYAGNCSKCNMGFLKGAKVFFYPNGKDILYGQCAEKASLEFNAMKQDEDNYNSF